MWGVKGVKTIQASFRYEVSVNDEVVNRKKEQIYITRNDTRNLDFFFFGKIHLFAKSTQQIFDFLLSSVEQL